MEIVKARGTKHYILLDEDSGTPMTVYGIVIAGTPVGDEGFIREWLRLKSTEISESIDTISSQVASIDPHCAQAVTSFSLQTQGDFVMSTNPPSQTATFSKVVDRAIERAFTLSLGSNLLNAEGTCNTGTAARDPSFTSDRAKLRVSAGGAGIRLTADREHFLNSILNVVPQMLTSTDHEGNRTPGFFENLYPTIGNDSFKDENKAHRWAIFLQSGSKMATDFKREYEKGKHLHSSLRHILMTANQTNVDANGNIYSSPIEGFGASMKKAQRRIQDERNRLKFQTLTLRAQELHIEDPRRMAFLANSHCALASTLLGNLPNAEIAFSANEWTTAVSIHMGLPIPSLKSSVGLLISNNENSRKLQVDPHGHHLSTVTEVKGGDTQVNHNCTARLVSESLNQAGIKHVGGGTDQSCKFLFRSAFPRGDVENSTEVKIKTIIADMAILSKTMTNQPLGNSDHLVDFKTLGAGDCYKKDFKDFGRAVSERQKQVSIDYHNTAIFLDRKLHGTTEDTRGPFQKVLLEYGVNGRVLGPVVGFFGEVSSDIIDIRDLCAQELAKRHKEIFKCGQAQAVGMFTHQLNRRWGHSVARGWSRLVLSRLRMHVDDNRTHSSTPEGRQTYETYNYFNGGNGAPTSLPLRRD